MEVRFQATNNGRRAFSVLCGASCSDPSARITQHRSGDTTGLQSCRNFWPADFPISQSEEGFSVSPLEGRFPAGQSKSRLVWSH